MIGKVRGKNDKNVHALAHTLLPFFTSRVFVIVAAKQSKAKQRKCICTRCIVSLEEVHTVTVTYVRRDLKKQAQRTNANLKGSLPRMGSSMVDGEW